MENIDYRSFINILSIKFSFKMDEKMINSGICIKCYDTDRLALIKSFVYNELNEIERVNIVYTDENNVIEESLSAETFFYKFRNKEYINVSFSYCKYRDDEIIGKCCKVINNTTYKEFDALLLDISKEKFSVSFIVCDEIDKTKTLKARSFNDYIIKTIDIESILNGIYKVVFLGDEFNDNNN